MSKFDKDALKRVPRAKIIALLQKLYPEGKLTGNKFLIGNVAGDEGESLRFYIDSGYWKDYADPRQRGGNVVALVAAQRRISYRAAWNSVREELGLGSTSNDHQLDSDVEGAAVPVPGDAPAPTIVIGARHPSPSKSCYILEKIYSYRDEQGRTLCFIHRFEDPTSRTKKGKPEKLVLPYTFQAVGGWSWKGLGLVQNPLYGLHHLAIRPEAYVLVVEGEKTADAAALLFPDHVVVTWMGGTGQLKKADFGPLRDRKVVYWPDADQPGLASVEVLARILMQQGVAEVRVVELPPQLSDGWDLADDPPEGVDVRALLGSATPYKAEAERLLRNLTSDELIARLVYNVGTDQFVDLISGYRWQSAQVNALFRHRETGMATKLLADERLRKVQRLAYLPGDENRIVREDDGLEALNLWKPSRVERQAGDASLFVDHLRYLCSSNEEFEHLANMLAFMVQRLGGKLMSSIVLVGPQGTGKSFLGGVMRELLGAHNTAEVTSTQIKSEFNQFMEAKLLVIVEEIMALGRIEVMNTLKPYITQTTVTINAKHLRPYSIENVANFLFLSNFEDALKLEDRERRYFVIMSDAQPHAQEYYDLLFAWERENRGVILDWLLSRDLSGFNPASRPPITEGKLRMVEASRDDTEVLISELLENHTPPFEHDLVELSAVHLKIRDMSAGTNVTRPTLIRALRANGAADLRQKKGTLDGIAVRASLWAVRDVDAYRKMPAQNIIDHFVKQGGILAKGPRRQEPEIKF